MEDTVESYSPKRMVIVLNHLGVSRGERLPFAVPGEIRSVPVQPGDT